jgi:hypothetical protein
MLRMTDASSGETRQAQYRYQLDFYQPLLTEEAVRQSYNNLMAKIGSQTQVGVDANGNVNWSGVGSTVGNPSSGAAPSIVPATQSSPSMGFAPSGNLTPGGALGPGGVGFDTASSSAVAFGLSQTPSAANSGSSQNTALIDIPSVNF